MTVPIMSLDCLKCHVEYVIFYYGGKFLDVVREHFHFIPNASNCRVKTYGEG